MEMSEQQIKELRDYAVAVLPVNGCAHDRASHDFIHNNVHVVECLDCREKHTSKA